MKEFQQCSSTAADGKHEIYFHGTTDMSSCKFDNYVYIGEHMNVFEEVLSPKLILNT